MGRGKVRRFAALVACLFAVTTALAAHPASAAQPNILVIVTDDQRQGTLHEMPRTRHFFFKEGRYFQRGFVTTPNCCPSRASIFTGLFAHNHGIRSNGTADLPQNVTMQRYLHDAGRAFDRQDDDRPWTPNPAALEADRSDKPPWIRKRTVAISTMQNERDKMLRTLMSVDDMVGKVFNELHALKERRDTLAIFLSDNGYEWGEHGIRGKWRPYTESIRVPLAMRWPGHFEPGSIDTGIATNVDLAPTILAAAGILPAAPMDGVSLLRPGTRQHLFTEFWGNLAKGRPTGPRYGPATSPTSSITATATIRARSFASTTGSTGTAGSSATSSTTKTRRTTPT